MNRLFDYGEAVRVVRNLRNDGTYPGEPRGRLLVGKGSVGYVRDVGTFLQDQVIYSVHFLDAGRLVGCREEELIAATAPWEPSRFEFRETVVSMKALSAGGRIAVEAGSEGQVMKVVPGEGESRYQVLFGQRLFLVPESALEAKEGG